MHNSIKKSLDSTNLIQVQELREGLQTISVVVQARPSLVRAKVFNLHTSGRASLGSPSTSKRRMSGSSPQAKRRMQASASLVIMPVTLPSTKEVQGSWSLPGTHHPPLKSKRHYQQSVSSQPQTTAIRLLFMHAGTTPKCFSLSW